MPRPAVPPAVPPSGEPMDLWPRRSVPRPAVPPGALPSVSLWVFGSGGRWPEQLCPQLCPQLSSRVASLRFFSLNSLPVGGFSRVSREPVVVFAGHRLRKPDVYRLVRNTMKDPPTQAVGNTSPLQKTPDMLRSRAAADTGMASQAKCIQTY